MRISLAFCALAVFGVTTLGSSDAGSVDSDPVPAPFRRGSTGPLGPRHRLPPIDSALLRAFDDNLTSSGVGFTRFGFNPSGPAAAPGSTWTFDHGAPDPLEGWVTDDATQDDFAAFRHVTAAIWSAHNPTSPPPAPVLSDSGSVWLGLFEDELVCSGWTGLRGYGDLWNQRLYSPPFQNLSGAAVDVSFDYFVDAEANYDFLDLYVVDDTLGSPSLIATFTGQQGTPASPVAFSQSVATGIGTFRLLFVFTSDPAWSDEDRIVTTVGPAGIDNVVLTNVAPAGPWTFETGLDGWTSEPVPGVGAFADSHDTAGFGLTACGVTGNAVGFFDPSDSTHPGGQAENFFSPPVPLDAVPPPRNIFAQMDLWTTSSSVDGLWNYAFQFHSDSCGTWSGLLPYAWFFGNASCLSPRHYGSSVYGRSQVVPANADSVRFVFQVWQSSPRGSGSYGSAQPLLDNVWIGVSEADHVLHVPSPWIYTIQAAVDSVAAGDTVLVAAGTYSGTGNCAIDFRGKDIVLLSESGAASTIIDCQGADRALFFHSGETSAAVVGGFTFTGGDSTIGGSAVRIGLPGGLGASSPTIRDCIIQNNAAQFPDSGVVLLEAGAPQLSNVLITGNRAPGGGAVIVSGGAPVFSGGFVSGNTGTGVVVGPVSATFSGTTISDNTDGGVHVGGSPSVPAPLRANPCAAAPTFTGCTISGNTTTASGGGILIDPVVACDYSPQFISCLVTGNSAGGVGGAVALLGSALGGTSSPSFDTCTITGNSAQVSGGAFYLGVQDSTGLVGGSVTVDGTIVWDNCSVITGAQIHVDASNEILLSCALVDTTSGAIQGPGAVTMTSVSSLAPDFCDPVLCGQAPTSSGDFHPSGTSPAVPGNPGNPCGFPIGALDSTCTVATAAIAVARPPRTVLRPCRPNPFRASTEIRFDLSRGGDVSLIVYDVAGRRVARLVDGFRPVASHRVEWNGRDGEGRAAASGIYFVRLVTRDVRETRRIVLLR